MIPNFVFAGLLISAFIGCLIGNFKNRKGLGLWLGFWLGPIGWIVMLFLKPVPEGENGYGLLIGTLAAAVVIALTAEALHEERERNRALSEIEDRGQRAISERRMQRLRQEIGVQEEPRAARHTPPPIAPAIQPHVVIRPLPSAKPTPSEAAVLQGIKAKYGAK